MQNTGETGSLAGRKLLKWKVKMRVEKTVVKTEKTVENIVKIKAAKAIVIDNKYFSDRKLLFPVEHSDIYC